VRDLWDNRRNRPKDEPTIGTDEIPVSQTTDVEPEGPQDGGSGDVGDDKGEPTPPPQPTSPTPTT